MNSLKKHLLDNSGDENVSKMIWIIVVFVVGGILLALLTGAFNGKVSTWYKGVVASWFDNAHGEYSLDENGDPIIVPGGGGTGGSGGSGEIGGSGDSGDNEACVPITSALIYDAATDTYTGDITGSNYLITNLQDEANYMLKVEGTDGEVLAIMPLSKSSFASPPHFEGDFLSNEKFVIGKTAGATKICFAVFDDGSNGNWSDNTTKDILGENGEYVITITKAKNGTITYVNSSAGTVSGPSKFILDFCPDEQNMDSRCISVNYTNEEGYFHNGYTTTFADGTEFTFDHASTLSQSFTVKLLPDDAHTFNDAGMHVDKNGDHVCDMCGFKLGYSTPTEGNEASNETVSGIPERVDVDGDNIKFVYMAKNAYRYDLQKYARFYLYETSDIYLLEMSKAQLQTLISGDKATTLSTYKNSDGNKIVFHCSDGNFTF